VVSEVFVHTPSLEVPPRSDGEGGGYRAFDLAWRDGVRPAMLVVRLKTGACFALGYAWLSRVAFDPTGVVSLTFPGLAVVVLTGRNLGAVFEGVAAHQALWVAEADRPAQVLAGDDEPVIESIRCVEPHPVGNTP
jgi:hypothetical protein